MPGRRSAMCNARRHRGGLWASRGSRVPVAVGVLLVTALYLASCTGAAPGAVSEVETAAMAGRAETAAALDDDMVRLTLYFRSGNGHEALLTPVERAVPVSDDLPRVALEQLLEGPTKAEGRGLDRPLPSGTEIIDFSVADDIAVVTLSHSVIGDARTVGNAPRQEALALAALANTLTEFPSIEQVRLFVDGHPDPEVFWGGWSLPDALVRDETLISPANHGDDFPDLSRFRDVAQSAGSGDAVPVRVANVRLRDRITYVRLVAELVDAAEPELPATASPPVKARSTSEGLVLDISDVVGVAGPEVPDALSDAAFGPLQMAAGPTDGSLRITLPLDSARDFYLHTMSGPTRIILDVKK